MYNVIVADDEKNIREGIVELIEWEKLGCKVCASMQNGAQVLKYLEEEKALEMDWKEREEIIRKETPDDGKRVICK